jgi:hypothetical protein
MASSVHDLAEPDFSTFSVESKAQSSFTEISGVNFNLCTGCFLPRGDYYKYQYTRTVSHVGEQVVNRGTTTSARQKMTASCLLGERPPTLRIRRIISTWERIQRTRPDPVRADRDDRAFWRYDSVLWPLQQHSQREDLNKIDTYYWRVDVVDGETTYTGHIFIFRLAHLAFPDAEGYGYGSLNSNAIWMY